MLRLSFVVHGSIYGRFMGCTGRKSARKPHRKGETHNLSKVSWFLFKSFYIRRLHKQLFFSHTNPYILNVTQQWGWDGDGHISGLGLPVVSLLFYLPTTVCVSNKTQYQAQNRRKIRTLLFCFVLLLFVIGINLQQLFLQLWNYICILINVNLRLAALFWSCIYPCHGFYKRQLFCQVIVSFSLRRRVSFKPKYQAKDGIMFLFRFAYHLFVFIFSAVSPTPTHTCHTCHSAALLGLANQLELVSEPKQNS